MKRFVAITLLLALTSCAALTETPPQADRLALTAVSFADLPGWSDDNLTEALPALTLSCTSLAKTTADWTQICAVLSHVPPNDASAARAFFETNFQPYAASGNNGDTGLFTGYYEAELHGDWKRHDTFQTPLYARPDDLVHVDLGAFKPELKGKTIDGKVQGHLLLPYDDRKTIDKGSLNGRAKVLLYVDDPVDAFFLAIQGSGRVRMADGSTVRVGYDGANGRTYVAIGRVLADSYDIPRPVTMQSIRAWITTHPGYGQDLMELNPSYIFFRLLNGEGPIGAEGVPLTPTRSMAVDNHFIPLGTPIWLNTSASGIKSLKKLVIAQDTGGAIKGPVRGDFFWGFGPEAERNAGEMQSEGRYYLLRPHDAPSIP